MRFLVNALSAVLLLEPMAAHADQFLYAGSNLDPDDSFNFTYVSDHRIVNNETVTPLSCTAGGQPCNSVRFTPNVVNEGSAEAFVEIQGATTSAAVSEINPAFFLTGTGYDEIRDAHLALFDLPDSVRYFYDVGLNGGPGFTFFSPELITSRTTVSDLLCSDVDFRPCTDGRTVTIDPAKGEISTTGFPGYEQGFDQTGLPPDFFTPGLNQIPSSLYPYNDTSSLIGGRGGAETVTPEPSSLLLLGSGVSGLAMLVRRQRRSI